MKTRFYKKQNKNTKFKLKIANQFKNNFNNNQEENIDQKDAQKLLSSEITRPILNVSNDQCIVQWGHISHISEANHKIIGKRRILISFQPYLL